MKIAAIIAEYNPFHTGHSYHIQQTRLQTGADYIIAVMSGDFVQRGGPAFLPKHLRAKMALAGGADVVIELPPVYSCESAEFFASSGVSLIDSLGCVDFLSFGSESGNLPLLQSLGTFLSKESQPFREELQKQLKTGISYPAARQNALLKIWADTKECADILSSPNNILGIEYCKALASIGSSISPVTVTRHGSGYHDTDIFSSLPSASGIRKEWQKLENDNDWSSLSACFPASVWEVLKQHTGSSDIISEDDFSSLFHYLLYAKTADDLAQIQDISSDLARRMIKNRDSFRNISQYILSLRSKDITYSRLCRAVFHIILDIKKVPPIRYARLLGFKKSAAPVLSQIKKKGRLPLITKLADAPSVLSPDALSDLEKNIQISHIYEAVNCEKQNRPFVNEFTRQLVIL